MQKNDLDIVHFRKKFPIFSQKVNGYPFIYFDSASTAQMPQVVVDAIVDYYTTYKANIGRGIYTFAEKATAVYENAREVVAKFIGACNKNIIFTAGATDSINVVARAWVIHQLQPGDEILVSAIEHHSNFLPWQQLALEKQLVLKIMPVTNQGIVDINVFKSFLSSKTKLVAIVHTSNVLGSTNDVELMTKLAHAVGAKVLIDASQSIAHIAIDVSKIACDFLVFSGHKLFGPTGVGVLYVSDRVIAQMSIISFGGGMVFSVSEKSSQFKDFPFCFEAGTPNIAGVIGLGAAIQFVEKEIDFEALARHETRLVQHLTEGLKFVGGFEIISFVPTISTQHTHLVTFYSKTMHAHDIAAYLDQHGIAVRAGHHCVQLFHQGCGINASVRVSFSAYNTMQEVQFFLDCLKKLTI